MRETGRVFLAVLRRPPDGRAAAVFPVLPEGEYELWLRRPSRPR
ncbi:hypothetical protein [uncultured Jatrophihabitans sp.]